MIHPRRSVPLKVGGLTPFTATDFPGRLSAVVFVQGCPWRCVYCHNPHLQPRTAESPLTWNDLHAFLSRRIGLIDAVVFSGGEPTMDPGLEPAIREVRAMGFQVGLHSGGTHPRRLGQVLPLVDWVGLDIKADTTGYDSITRVPGSGKQAFESLGLVLECGVRYEVRTTIHPQLHTEQQLRELAHCLAGSGVTHYALQAFRATGCEDTELKDHRYAEFPSGELLNEMWGLFRHFTLRDTTC